MLGTGIKTRRVLDITLRQISVRRHRRTRSSPRTHLTTSTLAERVLLRRRPQHSPLLLHLPFRTFPPT
jgi:hypothetical protein